MVLFATNERFTQINFMQRSALLPITCSCCQSLLSCTAQLCAGMSSIKNFNYLIFIVVVCLNHMPLFSSKILNPFIQWHRVDCVRTIISFLLWEKSNQTEVIVSSGHWLCWWWWWWWWKLLIVFCFGFSPLYYSPQDWIAMVVCLNVSQKMNFVFNFFLWRFF